MANSFNFNIETNDNELTPLLNSYKYDTSINFIPPVEKSMKSTFNTSSFINDIHETNKEIDNNIILN